MPSTQLCYSRERTEELKKRPRLLNKKYSRHTDITKPGLNSEDYRHMSERLVIA